MKLLVSSLKKEINSLQENEIKLNAIGNLHKLPTSVYNELTKAMDETKNNKKLTLTLALSYGSREEIIKTVQEISDKVKNNLISPHDIDETVINNHLYTQNLPDVDLLIRDRKSTRLNSSHVR